MRAFLTACAAVLIAAGIPLTLAQDAEPPRTLMPGKGVEITTEKCVLCHDAQHITRTKLSRGEWEFNIKNMIERGAPIKPEEIPPILEYLATYYNRDSAPLAAEASAPAESGDAVSRLLAANACTACHQRDKRLVGPSFTEVAARYAADGNATGVLAKKIKAGGAGVWGAVPMPPNASLSDADVAQLVGWILQQK